MTSFSRYVDGQLLDDARRELVLGSCGVLAGALEVAEELAGELLMNTAKRRALAPTTDLPRAAMLVSSVSCPLGSSGIAPADTVQR